MTALRCGVLVGDGIGPEIVPVAERVLEAAARAAGGAVDLVRLPIGFEALRQVGTTFPDSTEEGLRACDGWLMGPVDTAAYPPAAEGGLNPSGECRKRFELVSNVRPARGLPGVPCRYPELDVVVVRENTEGFYADRSLVEGAGELVIRPGIALAVGLFSAERITAAMREAVDLARGRSGRIAFAHKANVLPKTMGLYLKTVRAIAEAEPGIIFESFHLDALAARIVQAPAEFDVVLAENMSGDVLSDLTAGMVGGLGVAPSLNAGDRHAMAQAVHGSAPQIAGRGIANPSALVLSVAMLLRWWAQRGAADWCAGAAHRIEDAVTATIASGPRTPDLGGDASTESFGAELVRHITSAQD